MRKDVNKIFIILSQFKGDPESFIYALPTTMIRKPFEAEFTTLPISGIVPFELQFTEQFIGDIIIKEKEE